MGAALAFIGAASAVAALCELVAALGGRAPAVARVLNELAEAPLRLGREGRSPGAGERRRLLLAGAGCAVAGGGGRERHARSRAGARLPARFRVSPWRPRDHGLWLECSQPRASATGAGSRRVR